MVTRSAVTRRRSAMPARVHRADLADLLFLACEAPETPMHVGAIVVLDGALLWHPNGQLRLSEIRAAISHGLADAPQLRQVLRPAGPLAGRPVWVDDPEFQIDRHVLQVAVAPSGDEDAVLRTATGLLAPLLDRSHPLWRLWFVTGLPSGRVVLVVALHHVIADGSTAIRLLTSLLSRPPTADGRSWTATPAPHWWELAWDNVASTLARMRRLGRRSTTRQPEGVRRAGPRNLRPPRRAPRTSLNAPLGPRRSLAVIRVDLAAAKRIAHDHGGKVNDVILGVIAGGLRALLESRGEPVEEVSLHASVAVSLRAAGRPEQAANQVGNYVVRVPVGVPDPAARLQLIAAETVDAKRSQSPVLGRHLQALITRLGLARPFIRRQHLINFIESDMVGPPAPIHLLGSRVLDLVPINALTGNLTVTFVALSYAGRLTITAVADADRVPDLAVLHTAMERDWAQLATTVPER